MALNFFLKRSGTASKRPDAVNMSLGEIDLNYDSVTGGLFYKDSAGSVVKVGGAEVSLTAPNSTPAGSAGNSLGEFWYNTNTTDLNMWNGSAWVSTTNLSGYLPLSGGTMSGDIVLFSQVPVDAASPASKYYADQIAAGFKPQTAVAAATTAALAGVVTYNNGTAGVGATLTLNTPITAIDGVTITSVGTRVLIKNQASTFQNGVYTYTSGGATTVLTRATDADQPSELLAGNTYYVTSGTVNGTNTYIQIPTVATVGTSAITYSLTSIKPFHKYSNEWNVDAVGGDDTNGTGSEEQPYKTIAKALAMAGGGGARIILHQGTYPETVTITNQNIDIQGANRSGASIQGVVTFNLPSSSARVYGVQFLNNVVQSGAGGVYIQSSTHSAGTTITKSGSGYLELDDAAADSALINVTGAGFVNVFNTRIGPVTVNNASAVVTLQDVSQSVAPTVTLGTFLANASSIFSTTESGNALTASASSAVYLRNVNFYTPSGAPARVSLAGNYSFNDVVVDRANSTLGTNLGSIARFDALDTFGPFYANGSAGTSGQVLVSGGSSSAPTWGTPAAATPTVAGSVLGLTNATNTALGCNALLSNTTGTDNVAIGLNAGCSNVGGPGNIFIGQNAGVATVGGYNTIIGAIALCAAGATPNSVTALGAGALRAATGTGGSCSAALGVNAGCALTDGSWNTFVGPWSGRNITSGSCNVTLGANVTVCSPLGSCQLAIGFNNTCNWLTGDSNKHIRPGAGIRDTAGNLGTNGQVLTSTGTAVQWRNLPGTPAIRSNTVNYTTSSTPFGTVTLCYNTAINDTTGWYNGSTGVFQPNIPGYYQLSASARLFTGSGTEVGMFFSCNGNIFSGNGGFSMTQGNISSLVYMNGTTDALCVQMFSSVASCTIGWNVLNRFSAQLTALA